VFASPRSLDLRLLCTAKTCVKEMLDVWPITSIQIYDHGALATLLECGGQITSLLHSSHHDRVCNVKLDDFPTFLLDRVTTAMQKPFPALTEAFLGGSVPRLRSCAIVGI